LSQLAILIANNLISFIYMPAAKNEEKTAKKDTAMSLKSVYGVPLDITIVLGQRKMSISQILGLKPNSLLELDKKDTDPVEIHVNGKCIAYGEIVVVDGKLGVTVTEICDTAT